MYIVPDPVPAGYPAGSNPGDGLVYAGGSYTNVGPIRGPKGDTGADGAAGADGVAGADGADGAPGAAATVMAGSVTLGAVGSTPVVTNSGTTDAAVFDFTLPAAKDGVDGADGADGQDGENAEVYKQLDTPTAQRVGALWLVMAP
jgi:hypothetical protein